jgi:excinuclease ABC subunit C
MKPRFNVLMRDDKSFPYILLSGDHPAPQLTRHRGARRRAGHYFGPFASVTAVSATMNALQRAFLLRTCTDSFYANRTRPCLLWQIRRCSGPCTGEIALDDYAALVEGARDFLAGRSQAVQQGLAVQMNAAAERLEFEDAARLRDRIAALTAIQGRQGVNPRTIVEADVLAISEQAGQFCVEIFFFRAGQNWGNYASFPRADASETPASVLAAFIAQFYAERPAPALILLSHEIAGRDNLARLLSLRGGHKIEIMVPQRGERRLLVDEALRNAKEALGRQLAHSTGQARLLAALAQALGLERPLRRIEVYDNSHIAGNQAVGGMIVAGVAGFMKAHYRRFTMRDQALVPGDDYGMMREVLERRFTRLERENPLVPSSEADDGLVADDDNFPARPDLVVIDGGRGQFGVAQEVLARLGVEDVALVAIAKGPDRNAGRETFIMANREPFSLPPGDPALYFIQRLRDEAHRFAIGSHRAKRKKELVASPLDAIGGIGPARKRALLQIFGTAKAVAGASLADLEKVPGVNAAIARIIHDHFHRAE